ncbi:sugar ABC transporter permease [Caloranaerobacter ferrireducens]|uniref:sugar ABC transporter permease n=1 Tax=Caloranaerobacter ferrireducens TaxID=1323370 RepID=UPI00084DF3B5|nr:sugar ABC transporter permease [Caloranaerobacter ferrireducens]
MKKSKKAAIYSALFMGAGQLYNRDWIKAIFFAMIEIVTLLNIFNGVVYHSIWGLITLGETRGINGDHSINLMLNGILTLILLIVVGLIYIYNIRDAKHVREKIEKGINPFKPSEYLKYIWNNYFPHILLAPSAALILFFTFLPILFTILIAFTNYSGPYHLPPGNLVDWIGFKNFIKLFKMEEWSGTIWAVGIWTILWAIITTALNYFAGLGLALLTNAKGVKFKKFWRSLFILPYAIPAFISLLIFRLVFMGPGPVNTVLLNTGVISEKIPFLTDHMLAKIMVILVYCWTGAPYWMALMSGVLTNIDKSLYEAADIDGATKWQQFYKITVPMVLFQTAPLLIMTFAHNFNNFGMIYLLTSGNPVNANYKYAGSTDILISWIYKMTLEKRQFGMAAAVTLLLFIFVASIAIYSFRRTKSFKEEDMI